MLKTDFGNWGKKEEFISIRGNVIKVSTINLRSNGIKISIQNPYWKRMGTKLIKMNF